MICDICPHYCVLQDGEFGKCQVIRNYDGSPENAYYALASIVAVDHIEKRPLFHFNPGGKYLSVGFLGCSMSCDFCQNHKVSQTVVAPTKVLPPTELISEASSRGVDGLAFSFNEPTVHWDYVRDVSQIKGNLKVVVKSSGFVNRWVLSALNEVDAYNIDIKGDEEEYAKHGGDLDAVLENVEWLSRWKHVEISYVVPPRLATNIAWNQRLCERLRDFGDLPIHLLYMYPFHNHTESYDKAHILSLREIFAQQFTYVYISNLYSDAYLPYRNTKCPGCGSVMANREGNFTLYRNVCCGYSPFK